MDSKSCKRNLFFFDRKTIAVDNEEVVKKIICIITDVLIYL